MFLITCDSPTSNKFLFTLKDNAGLSAALLVVVRFTAARSFLHFFSVSLVLKKFTDELTSFIELTFFIVSRSTEDVSLTLLIYSPHPLLFKLSVVLD